MLRPDPFYTIEKVKLRIISIGQKREIRETRVVGSYSAEEIEIVDKITEIFGIKREEIFSKKRGNIYRQLALYLIKRYTSLSLGEIGKLFDMDYAAVSQAAGRFNDHRFSR